LSQTLWVLPPPPSTQFFFFLPVRCFRDGKQFFFLNVCPFEMSEYLRDLFFTGSSFTRHLPLLQMVLTFFVFEPSLFPPRWLQFLKSLVFSFLLLRPRMFFFFAFFSVWLRSPPPYRPFPNCTHLAAFDFNNVNLLAFRDSPSPQHCHWPPFSPFAIPFNFLPLPFYGTMSFDPPLFSPSFPKVGLLFLGPLVDDFFPPLAL